MSNMFYVDKDILYYEKELMYNNVIERLEKIYETQNDEQVLSTLIAYSWYFLTEGDINQVPVDYNWEYFHNRLEKYLEIGFNKFSKEIRFCYVAGYILDLHWMNIDSKYENVGKQLMSTVVACSCENSDLELDIKKLAEYFLTHKKQNDFNEVLDRLFSNQSCIDRYFYNVLE